MQHSPVQAILLVTEDHVGPIDQADYLQRTERLATQLGATVRLASLSGPQHIRTLLSELIAEGSREMMIAPLLGATHPGPIRQRWYRALGYGAMAPRDDLEHGSICDRRTACKSARSSTLGHVRYSLTWSRGRNGRGCVV